MSEIEKIIFNDEVLAIVIRGDFVSPGVTFATPDGYHLQLGVHNQHKGAVVQPHVHMPFKELINVNVQEMFHLTKGKMRVDLFKDGEKVADCTLNKDDTILLIAGHGIEFLEDTRMIEIKQGPYRGQENEKRFIE